MEKKKKTGKYVKKPPLPSGKLVKCNFSMTPIGFKALEKLERLKACKTHAEAFHTILSVASVLEKDLIALITSESTETVKMRRTFGVNEYTLSGLRRLAKKYDLAVESIIETTVIYIDAFLSWGKTKPFKDKDEALEIIDNIMTQVSELRWKLEKTFSGLGFDYDDPEDPAYHLANVNAGLDGLYFLVKDKLFEKQA